MVPIDSLWVTCYSTSIDPQHRICQGEVREGEKNENRANREGKGRDAEG